MTTEEETDTLKIYWDHFFKAETGTYEKSTWLDLFLAEFLIRINDGANPKELIRFCPVSGVVTLVGCELLCGIHRVTSSINTHYTVPLPCLDTVCSGKETPVFEQSPTPPLPEPISEEPKVQITSLFTKANSQSSTEILRKYVLGGVAWRCLVLLRALGVEGLSCCRQLSSVLIWLFDELSGATSTAPHRCISPVSSRTPIHQLFSHKIWSQQKLVSGQGSKVNSATSSEKGSFIARSKHGAQVKADSTESKSKRKSTKNSEITTEESDSNDDLQILNRSITIQICSPNDGFDYFNTPVRSSNEFPNETLYSDPYYTPRKAKPKVDDYMTDKHKEILNSEITSFEFVLIIIDLLQELCKAESSLSGAEGSQISVQCINFSLRNLCSLQFGSVPALSPEDVEEASELKVALTELLIVSLDKVLIHSDLCSKLINNGILPMLLRILEDVVCKSSSKFRKNDYHNRAKDVQIPSKTESENLLKFVFGISYSVTAFFHCLLMQCRSVEKLREFTDQFKLYAECLKGGLLKDCIELMIRIPGLEQKETVVLIKKLIETVGKLVCGMKRVRSEVIHSAACPRSRHKVCRQRVAAGMHHHHDILGEASTGLPMASACSISILYGTLTSLVTDEEVSAEPILRSKILKVMLNCGVCCCFSPGALMESIVRLMLTHNSVASLCLQVLEHSVYGELGASVLIPKVTDQLPCSICEPCEVKREFVRKCSHGISPVDRKSIWSFLIHYNSLLQLDNHNNVLHATVSHLLRVTPKCRIDMKYELLFSVIYPTFIVAKHRYILRLEESAYFLTVSCLNIFASLLNTVSFAEQFIQKGGLSYVLELVSLSEFSNQCCSILEIAIIVEILKLIKENSNLTYFREISSLASVQMLFKSLSDMTDKCFKIFKLKLMEEQFEELSDLTKEREMLAFTPESPDHRYTRTVSLPQAIRTSFASNENVVEDSIEDYIEVLKNIWTFWKTCAELCLYSPMFREYVVSESVFLDSYGLLKLLLHYLCHCECGVAETRILIKIMEAVLTVQFAVSDVTSGRSKETSCGLIRTALDGAETTGRGESGEGGGGLHVLCEALLRVATAKPSLRHSMPALTHAKVPPLLCPSGGSSVACSSSEESAPAPYASEHSDSRPDSRPDDGYEADVEIGKLDMTSYKLKKLSESLSSIGSNYVSVQKTLDSSVECSEYIKNAELAHPELCIIVVDILTQLIDKLVSASPSTSPHPASLRRAARACCARLCGGLARARRPPLGLLSRLLGPPVAALLTRTDPHIEDLQRSILELIHSAASQSISPVELGELLKLLAAERPPLELLLPALQRLAAAAPHNTPDCALTFPIEVYRTDDNQSPVDDKNLSVNHQAESFAKKLRESHITAGVGSAWALHAARCGTAGAGWAAWLAGFAALVWLRPQPPHNVRRPLPPGLDWNFSDDVDDWQEDSSETEAPVDNKSRSSDLLHVFSVGHDSLMFELWLEPATGSTVFRLSRPEADAGRAIVEARGGSLPAHRWSCVALNVTDRVIKRRMHIQVTMYVDGYEHETVSMPLQGILVRKVTPSYVLLGHVGGSGAAYQMSSLQLYRAALLTRPRALHLAAHGPDHSCQVRCEAPNYPLILTPDLLDTDMDWDQMYEITHSSLRELHDALLLTFSAHAPAVLNLYQQTVVLPTVFGSRAGVGGAGGPPSCVRVRWAGAATYSRHCGLAPALLLLGGPQQLLYMFARVVELQGSAEQQATALSVVLSACRADGRLHAALYDDDALDMLHTVFAAPACRMSHHLLKERYLNSECGPLEEGASESLVQLVRALLGAPPQLAQLAHLADFLLLMHQASDTFVTHSRANFYFLLTSEIPDMSEFMNNTRKPSRRSRRSENRPSTSSMSDEITSENSPIDLKENMEKIEEREHHSVGDTTKQMKGIINKQIKESRKHNTSSTSENSDTTIERSDEDGVGGEAGEPEQKVDVPSEDVPARSGEEELNEYIVVDVDDVQHTTVEMYTSGIYQQRRVRAGAAPGWTACAGLLLVLRDALLALPDHDAQAAGGAVSADSLAVLANHRVGSVRAAVVRALAALQRRSPRHAHTHTHVHPHYYMHLANQISLYEGSWELAAACASLITKCDVPLEDQLDEDIWADVSENAVQYSPPLLALLPACVRDPALAHNIMLLQRRLIDKASVKSLCEVMLPEACVRALRVAATRGSARTLQELQALLAHFALKVLAAHQATQIIVDVHHMLSYVEMTAEEDEPPQRAHQALMLRLLDTLLIAASGSSSTAVRPKWWAGSGADWVSPLQQLFWWAGGGAAGARDLQPALLRALYRAPPQALQLLAPPDPPSMRKLAVYLLMMLKHIHAASEDGRARLELAITDWARGWAVSTQAGLPERLHSDSLMAEADALLRHDLERWARAANRQRPAIAKVVFSKDALASKLTETAMCMTRGVVESQNCARKAFLEHLRRSLADRAAAAQRWRRLVADLTHEQAIWHEARSYPQSWQLDPTEGPGRVRVRLRRAHLRIHPQFLKPEHKHKAELCDRPPPLHGVLGGPSAPAGAAARLQPHETVAHMARATHVQVASDTRGELLLSDRCVHFVPDGSGAPHSWPLERVVAAATRRWCLREHAVELFLSSGHAQLLAFEDEHERAAFLRALSACHLPAKSEPDTLSEAMSQWRSGMITNWEYLMRLNGLGGRSYNDLMQYPVLPFVLADYTSRILDLNNPASFRDLSKPMAVQNKSREQHYINTYNDLQLAQRDGCSPLARQPHHYASLYSNSGGVLHYLVRLPPFTELFLNYQDNKFDMPDRTFHSLATTWRLITNDSPTDVKELIPELFYLPELFYNNEGLELGVRQCGAGVDAVELPAWAADARLFTLVLRQALEAPLVTDTLPHWIDLVFGYKQTGQPAIDALNVFPACTYYGFDPLALVDEVDRTAAAAMVRTYGQAPRQLLRQPHPQRAPDLRDRPPQPNVWAGVEGARWGRWCGSPAQPPPIVRARRSPGPPAAGEPRRGGSLHALQHARTVALVPDSTALVAIHGEAGTTGSLALLSWGHADDVLRLRRRRDQPGELLMRVPALDQITCVWSCTHTVFVGHATGRVLSLRVGGAGSGGRVRARPLHAHRAPVCALHACARAALLVSASRDGCVVLWDLNKLTYIRTLPNRDMLPVTHVTVSETLCDVATVHDPAAPPPAPPVATPTAPPTGDVSGADSYEQDADKYKSLIRVHTVNAAFVGSVKVAERVTSVCYSNAAEGVSVNCVAAALQGGGVLLYSSWDLRRVAYIAPAERSPLLSLVYSNDSQILFGMYGNGVAVAWESGGSGGSGGAGGAGGGAAAGAGPPRLVLADALL
ncbi:LOW QUALITY PROTEIN: lysosomal-trafficking regulator mauve [Aphomia sociella]